MKHKKPLHTFFNKITVNINLYAKKYTLTSLGIMIFVFYIFMQRWFTLSSETTFIQIAIVLTALSLMALKKEERRLTGFSLTRIETFWLIGLLVIIVNVILVGYNKYLFDIFMYTLGFAFLLLGKIDIEKYRASFSLVKFLSVIYAVGSILQYFFTDIFNMFIYKFADIYTQQVITLLNYSNYYPGFGLTRPAVTAVFVATGIMYIISFWDYRNKFKISINILLLLILFSGLVMTGKRSVLLWLIVAHIVVFVSTAQRGDLLKRLLVIIAAIPVGVFITGLILQYYSSSIFLERVDSLYQLLIYGIDVTGSAQVRLMIYKDALLLGFENPLLGIGWHQFVQVTSGLYPADYHVHNLYIQLFCEMGIVGFTAVMLPLIYTYIATFKALKSSYNQPGINKSLWSKSLTLALFFQTLFLLHNITENPFYVINPVLIYFFMISIVNAYFSVRKHSLEK